MQSVINISKKATWIVFLSIFSIAVIANVTYAGGHGEKKAEKKGILLVAFGTSVPSAQKALDAIDKAAKDRFPETEIRWAYTSKIIRHKLAKEGKILLSPAEALAKMADEDFTHVAVQSFHSMAGAEFHDLFETAKAFQRMPEGMERVIIGRPLLSSAEDMKRVAQAILSNVPKERKKDEAVVLMGHGSHHPGNAVYAAMAYVFNKLDPNVSVGTVEGYPEIADVQEELLARGNKVAWLMPFMSVAGDHALNDMAGDEEDSWKSILSKAGIECRPVLKGTAEYPEVVDVWLDHLAGAFGHFE